ncbi:hypothetical protein THF5H11_140015 [Vibrio jasicida]|nr:hypothetical protein THF5H11_140015 [Vibrio jasicida]
MYAVSVVESLLIIHFMPAPFSDCYRLAEIVLPLTTNKERVVIES